jgi:hypothetical protein
VSKRQVVDEKSLRPVGRFRPLLCLCALLGWLLRRSLSREGEQIAQDECQNFLLSF